MNGNSTLLLEQLGGIDSTDDAALYVNIERAPRTFVTGRLARSGPVPTTSPVRGESSKPMSVNAAIDAYTAEVSATARIAPAMAGPSMAPTASIHPVTTIAAVASAAFAA